MLGTDPRLRLLPSGPHRDRLWSDWTCLLILHRTPTRWRSPVQASQCLAHRPRYSLPLGRLARVQRRINLCCQPPSGHGHLHHQLGRSCRWVHLDGDGLEAREEVELHRLLHGRNLWSCCHHPCCRVRRRPRCCSHRCVPRFLSLIQPLGQTF